MNLLLQDLDKWGLLPHSYPQALFLISRCANYEHGGTCFPRGPTCSILLSTSAAVSASCFNVSPSLTADGSGNKMEISPSPGLKS